MSKERVYVTCDGILYRFTEGAWRHYLEAVVRGQESDPRDFATMLHAITADVSELDAEVARLELSRAERRRVGLEPAHV